MGSPESSPLNVKGKVDGRPVTFTYHRGDIVEERQLIWTEGWRLLYVYLVERRANVQTIQTQRPQGAYPSRTL